MSRIGKMPIDVPKGVDVKISDGNEVSVKGPKGSLSGTFDRNMLLTLENSQIIVKRPNDEKRNRAMHGLTRSLISNMVTGVTAGFEKALDINGVGYRAQKQGKKLVLLLGYSHPVEMEDPDGITTEVVGQNRIIVRGIDKQAVGEFAAKIRIKRKPEVYKGKGIKYEYEVIRRKEGKTGAKGKK
ncbi:MAG: 50S ribosomal protein L6 [Clostridiales bacterium]|jgi:large subunit ribosomal protein L6|nr:50S ribosomal protein L6 [Clostridiales bacterium]